MNTTTDKGLPGSDVMPRNVLITGGSGFLGRAIIRRGLKENWNTRFTVLSRDPEKHHAMLAEFPNVRYLVGDICDMNGLSKAFMNIDLVIHAAAQKHIPDGELNVAETHRVNVQGSINVARAAVHSRVGKVIGISTDKVCHPVNVYGASKMLMERLFQEYDKLNLTRFHIVRYGNVLASTGSVLNVWRKMMEKDCKIVSTDPKMTRFWMSVDDAVDAIVASLSEPHGTITIPHCKAMSIGEMLRHTFPPKVHTTLDISFAGLRPGEKMYEQLITDEEHPFAELVYINGSYYARLHPVTDARVRENFVPLKEFSSNTCMRFSGAELEEMTR